ncbi:MAG: glycerol-3-phosphate dehydrogenase subunit GlpB, partial [Desulfobacterales bacterium]|nr:glycerol-3-phosphate dehydrogenase subunit GlpB [Desulfobacterales bacterium]
MAQSETIHCQLMVIGAGMAGMAAALFAARRHVSTVQVGLSAEIIYASGLIDLLGVHPIEKGRRWRNPWAAIAAVSKSSPNHPFSRLSRSDIRAALDEFIGFLATAGLPYRCYKDRNADVVTPVGSIKRTYAVPESMWSGVMAWHRKCPCLIIDFHGMKGFSARQIQSVLDDRWPALRSARVAFPDLPAELYPERMAHALELSRTREQLAAAVRPLVKDAKMLGLPAICGTYQTSSVMADLQKKIGVPVFEIPTLPPAISGLRLKNAFEQSLPSLGVATLYNKKVIRVQIDGRGHLIFDIGAREKEITVQAQAAILASGRFIGQGLTADRKRIRETIFDLTVSQPSTRQHWHREHFLDLKGHAINRAGLEIDECLRPLTADGRPAYENLYAAGSILA